MNALIFGIGNFYFSLSNSWTGDISYGNYLAEVKRTLEQLPFVEDIQGLNKIDGESPIINENTNPPYPRIRDGEFPVPGILELSSNVSFVLHIPHRMQVELAPFISAKRLKKMPEKFRVHMRMGFHSSLSFVECLNVHKSADILDIATPSDAVVVTREILKREIPKVTNLLIFDCLGPSPFHANFMLTASTDEIRENTPPITPKIIVQPGYNLVFFYYNPSIFSSCEEAKEELFHQLEGEVSVFYLIISKRAQLIRKWDALQHAIDTLAESEDFGSSKESSRTCKIRLPNWMKRITGGSRLVEKTVREMGLLRIEEVNAFSEVEKAFRDQYETEGFIEMLVRKEKDALPHYPLNEAKDLIDSFDRKSSKSVELLVIIVAALLAAIVGGTITNLFS